MDLIRAHQMVETGHRHDAYAMVVHYAASGSHQGKNLAAIKKHWTFGFAIVMELPDPVS